MDPAVASSLNVQAQIRRNAEEQANFLRGMGDWEKEIKQRDAELKTKKKAKAKARRAAAPRQRESGGTVKTKMTISKATAEDFQISKEAKDTIDSKSRGSHERGVFLGTGMGEVNPANIVVPGAITEVDRKSIPAPKPRRPTDELENEERMQGNEFFKKGDYENAVRSYTRCLGINTKSGVAYSNRAMCHLKTRDWIKAEKDATAALNIDPRHVKSYQRRSAAKVALGKLRSALKDLMVAEEIAKEEGGIKGIKVDIRKCREALRDAVRRAPKKRIGIQSVSGVGRPEVGGVVEEEVVLELGEGAGGFDLDDAPTISQNQPSFLDAASKAAAAAAKNVKLKAPKNAYDMEKMWRSLKNNEADKAKYLMEYVCANKKLAKLFPNGFQDSVMFDEIVGVLDGVVGADAEGAKRVLIDLAKVKNVDMISMMADKNMLKRVVEKAYRSESIDANIVKKLL
ncbi:hypothetical protein TrST_g13290 [Triparma strigata]|uniref:RNA-polymerase II-associated protein 3-like C-terminal domain-containing protein n=1 Tax=Triparma strigata TaxID=1606541 RepID=A0A9W7BH06_9STRA|nr:hypothetical protein TrST_g13290 [Triparma strigata]